MTDTKSVNNSKEDAITEREYELLLEGAQRLRDPYDHQCRFVIVACGRLGLRAGEVAHMTEEWIDWNAKTIDIPLFEACEKGRQSDEPCGYCRERARSIVEHNEGITFEQALETRWSPKTAAGARSIAFDFDTRVQMTVERFFDRYDRYPHSRVSVNRRVDKAVEEADGLDENRIYPHALRATAASYHGSRGLTGLPLQSLLGWERLSTAENYLNGTKEATARAVRSIHGLR
ncbi:site-specific integrase [Halomarina rubra]|uniref:Tyrosine-type recombinase/integrase n=1 Tax=Halomarina rubra TaxID=2071873 RepID=A0ABD6B0Z0_9EURY|nr:site-specific integrase [Halomarina rubra]